MDINPLDVYVINAASGDEKFRSPPHLKANELSQNFVTFIYTKVPDTVTNWRRNS
jgi:hypothetical protein